MLSAFGMAFKTPDLRKKIFFTLSIMALFRFGSVVPTPGVSYTNVKQCLATTESSGLFGLINLFSGGALIQLSVFALGIMPYITASIIVQLLTVVIPRKCEVNSVHTLLNNWFGNLAVNRFDRSCSYTRTFDRRLRPCNHP
jgi:preprotein translocase subunit SecY